MKLARWTWMTALAVSAALAAGCNQSDETAEASGGGGGLFGPPRVTVPAGSEVEVRLAQTISSETAKSGDAWRGTVTQSVIVEGKEVIPAGSSVEGVVTEAQRARRGDRAQLALGVRAIRVDDRKTSLTADSEPVIAGSPRARNLGAIAGGAAAGALLGKAIGGDGDDAAKGAILGGAAATGVVAASKGYQVVLKEGTVMSFAVRQDVAVALD